MNIGEQQKQQIKNLLNGRLEQLEDDQDLLDRLSDARSAALQRANRNRIRQFRPMLGWVAAASLVLVILLPRLTVHEEKVPDFMQAINLTDMELISELELFEDDLEFYFWLEETDAYSG